MQKSKTIFDELKACVEAVARWPKWLRAMHEKKIAAEAWLERISTHRPKKIRLSLDVSPECYETLNRMAADIGGTKSDVFRKALALMDLAVKVRSRGQKIGIAGIHETLAIEIIGL